MTVDVSTLVTLVTGAGGAVGAVGIAVTSVKFLTTSFRHYREVMGYSVQDAMRQSRADQQAALRSGMSAADREAHKTPAESRVDRQLRERREAVIHKALADQMTDQERGHGN